MMWNRTTMLSIVASIAFLVSPVSRGDEQGTAKGAFQEGSDLFHDGRFEEAAQAFRRANALSPSWKLLYNIGQSEAAAKRHGLALQAFEAYLSEGGDDIEESRREEVAREVERLRGIVGEVSVTAPDGASIFLGGRQRGTAPLPGAIPVPAGKLIKLVVEKDDEILVDREILVGSGRSIEIDAILAEETAMPPEEPAPGDQEDAQASPEAADKLAIGGWILVGVGGATLIGSAITGGVALGLDDELKDACPDSDCGPDRHGDVDRLRRLSVASDVMTGVGAAVLAAGATMVIVSLIRGKSGQEDARVELTPVAGARRAGLVFSGRF